MESNNTTTNDTKEALIKDVGTLKEDAAKIVQDVKAHATAHVDETKKKITTAVSTVHSRVSEHPFAILGIGLALGYVFGARRRRHRS